MRQTLLCVTATAFLYTSDTGGTPSALVSDREGDFRATTTQRRR